MKRNLLFSAVAFALGLGIHRSAVEGGGGGASETLLDLDDVLNTNVDGVEDAPEFVTPPAGSYILSCADAKAEKYKTNDKETGEEQTKTRLKIIYSVVNTKELSDAEEVPVANGALFSEQFMTNQDGLSYFKRQAKNILGETNIAGATIGEILKELPAGHTFAADVKIKTTNGKDRVSGANRVFTNVQVRIKPNSPAELPVDAPVAEAPKQA